MSSFEVVLRLIRIPNLIIVAITQLLVWYLILIPAFENYHLSPYLDSYHLFLLILCTVIITASGNVVNDLYDIELDRINKPTERIVGNFISKEDTYRLYIIILLIGAIIAFYLAFHLGRIRLFIAYPIACLLLWSYSRWFKRLPISGNLIVSIFVACIPLVLLIPEWKNIYYTSFLYSLEHKLIWSLAGFAFATNLLREFIKDIIDIKGDKVIGSNTLAVVLGPKRGRNWALVFAIILLVGFGFWMSLVHDKVSLVNLWYFSIALVGPLIIIIIKLILAKKREHYKQLNWWIKLLIVLGILYMFFF